MWDSLHNNNWFDLYQFLGTDYKSMDSWLQKFGLQKNDSGITGKQIPQLFKEQKYDKIEEYVVGELYMCENLFHQLLNRYPTIFNGKI